MRRIVLGAVVAVAALGAVPASAQAVRMCGQTYQPACTLCVDTATARADGRVCVPVNPTA